MNKCSLQFSLISSSPKIRVLSFLKNQHSILLVNPAPAHAFESHNPDDLNPPVLTCQVLFCFPLTYDLNKAIVKLEITNCKPICMLTRKKPSWHGQGRHGWGLMCFQPRDVSLGWDDGSMGQKRGTCVLFAFLWEGTGDISWVCIGFPSVPATGKFAFHWKSPLLLLVAQQSSLCSHCQKGLRTYYPLYIQLSQAVDWPLTFSKEFPHMFASQKFLRMWLPCFVFAMGCLPYFLVTDWDQVRKMLVFHMFQWTCPPIF